jgi:hypothetical protein
MATKGQTHAKREREMALKERRERKRAKKAEAAAQRAADNSSTAGSDNTAPGAGEQAETARPEWIQ